MRRILGLSLSAAIIAAPFAFVVGSSPASGKVPVPSNKTVRTAGPQHFCGTNGITCTEPALDWDEYAGYDKAVASARRSRATSATTSPQRCSIRTGRVRATTSRTR